MAEDFRIDSHKLIFHPERVSEWLSGKNIYPVCVEISPSGNCNHRCVFCGLDYLEYKPVFLNKDLILGNLEEMVRKGVKSIVVAGEGEPLLNVHTPEIVNRAKSFGLDVSMSSNGVLFTEEIAEKIIGSLTWVRFSVNAGTEETHQKVHRGKPGDFEKALSNIEYAVRYKQSKGYRTTVGVQLLLIPENVREVVDFAKLLKSIGVDYFTVKPFSKHPKSVCSIDPEFDYEGFLNIEHKLNELAADSYQIFFRSSSMKKKKMQRRYDKCWGLPFWAYIDANAEVWACLAYIGDKDFSYGNLNEKSFTEVWEGKERANKVTKTQNMCIDGCRELCRLDEINAYLNELKNPGRHVNFI